MPKKATVQARIEDELRAEFDWALEESGLQETQFLTAAIRAFIRKVKEQGWIPSKFDIEIHPPKKTGAGIKTTEPGKNADLARSTPYALYAEDLDAPSPSSIASSRLNEEPARPSVEGKPRKK